MSKPLTHRQRRFVEEYLVDLNATQAAIRAGYSKKTAEQGAAQLLRNIKVLDAIAKAQEARSIRTGITQDMVLEELAKIGFANMKNYIGITSDGDPFMDLSELTEDKAAALAEVTVEDFKEGRGEDARDVRRIRFKLYDKRAALVDIGRHLGMSTDSANAAITSYQGTRLIIGLGWCAASGSPLCSLWNPIVRHAITRSTT